MIGQHIGYRYDVNLIPDYKHLTPFLKKYIEHTKELPSEYSHEGGDRMAKFDDNVFKVFYLYTKNFEQYFIKDLLKDKIVKDTDSCLPMMKKGVRK